MSQMSFYGTKMVEQMSCLVWWIWWGCLGGLLVACYKQWESITSDKAVQVLVALCSVDFADIHADVRMQKRTASKNI